MKPLPWTVRLTLFAAAALSLSALPSAPSDRPAELVIRDNLDRRVTIPDRVARAVSLEPEITRLIVALGAGDRLVGIDYFLKTQDRVLPLVFPAAGTLPVVSYQGQFPNFEEIVRLRPDLVFSSPSEFEWTQSLQQKIRTPVAALASLGRFANLLEETALLGRIFDRPDRADDLADYFRRETGCLRRGRSREPRVYLSFWGSLLRTPVRYEPVEAAGGRNCASGLLPAALGSAATTVSVEQIVRWNPDIILIQGNYPPDERAVTVEDVLSDSRLASVSAVRERRVHYTFGFWYWWDPALVVVETAYLASLFHPQEFPGFDLDRTGRAAFEEFYGSAAAFAALAEALKCHEWLRR